MANKPLDTSLLDRALVFAVRAHAGTERRGKGFPYIVHPLEAVEIVATMTRDQELIDRLARASRDLSTSKASTTGCAQFSRSRDSAISSSSFKNRIVEV